MDVSRLESASAVLPQLLLRDLQRQRMACLPRVSIEIYGRCPAPGPPVSHGDFRLGLAAKDARAGAPTAAPFPPPAPAGSVRCWRRAGLPRAVVRVCKEKCAIPDLEESVALNSLVPYDMKHTIRVCGKNASKRYPALCVQNKITIHRREETCIPSNRGIQRQAPTTLSLATIL